MFDELRDYHPEWHTYIVYNYTVHLGTGKKIVGTDVDLTAAESATAAPAGLATPRRRTAPRADETSPATLSRSQDKLYMAAPLLSAKTDKDIAAFIVRSCTSAAGRTQLRTAAGDSGRAALLHIEERGKGAAGSPLQIAASLALGQLLATGPADFSSDSWHTFSADVQFQATAAGVTDPATVAGHVRAGVYHFPALHRSPALTASASAATPAAVTQAVDDYVQSIHAGHRIASYRMPQPPPAAGTTTPHEHPLSAASDGDLQRLAASALPSATTPLMANDAAANPYAALAASRARWDPPKWDPPTTRGMPPPRLGPWSAKDHQPCLNWVREREGC